MENTISIWKEDDKPQKTNLIFKEEGTSAISQFLG